MSKQPETCPHREADRIRCKSGCCVQCGRCGMSIVGNDEAPKSLVIVPWKSAELGDTLDVSRALDDGRRPVDREVFMRELDYYQITTGSRAALDPASQ